MATRTALRRTVDEINALFPNIYKKYHSMAWRRIAGLDLTFRAVCFLKVLQHGAESVGEVARGMSLTSSTVSTLAKRMEAMGFIRRVRPSGDERRVELTLRRAGRRLVGSTVGFETGLLTSALQRMASADRAALLRGLRKLDEIELGDGRRSVVRAGRSRTARPSPYRSHLRMEA